MMTILPRLWHLQDCIQVVANQRGLVAIHSQIHANFAIIDRMCEANPKAFSIRTTLQLEGSLGNS